MIRANRKTTPCCKGKWLWAQRFGMRIISNINGRKIYTAKCDKCSVEYKLDGGKSDPPGYPVCSKCHGEGHEAKVCKERRIAKLWPGQFVFRGTIRTPQGTKVDLEMPLGPRGQSLLTELAQICADKGKP